MLQIFWFSCCISATHAAGGDGFVTNHTVMPLNKKGKRANWVPCRPDNGARKDHIISTLKFCKKSSLLVQPVKDGVSQSSLCSPCYCQVDMSREGYTTVKAQISGNSLIIWLNIRAYVFTMNVPQLSNGPFWRGLFIFREWILSTSEKHGFCLFLCLLYRLEEIPIMQSWIDAGNMSW